MEIKLILPEPVMTFMDVFKKNGYEIYVVGGAIRDLLLSSLTSEVEEGRDLPAGRQETSEVSLNWDFTTNATPEEIQKLFPENFYNNTYGTVSVPVTIDTTRDGKTLLFEVTPYRKESDYTDSRHPDTIEWSEKIEDDLARRDFTVNALAYDGEKIIDLFNGMTDMKNKVIRAVGDADKRFGEDALRLMRAVRLATQLGFLIEDTTREAIVKNAALIQKISGERIRDELFKIIASNNPADGILFLKNTGLLAQILPEVDICFTIPQKSPGRHHIFDVGTHLVQALRLCPSTDTITRFATLLHDIGKAPTFKKDETTGLITFFNHEHVGAQMATQIADRLRLSNKEKDKVVTLVQHHMFTVSEKQSDKAIRRFIRNVGKEYLFDILDLRIADRLGSGAKLTSWRTELFKKRLGQVQQEPFKITDLQVNGHDVMTELKIRPSPQIGMILKEIFDAVVEGRLKNEHEELLAYLRRDIKNSKSGTATNGEE